MDDFPLYSRRPSCDTLALAMCDPGLRRRHSSECEEDSLPEIYMDSGLSTLRGSHGGYDSELEVKGHEEEDGEQRVKKKLKSGISLAGDNCDVEVRRSPICSKGHFRDKELTQVGSAGRTRPVLYEILVRVKFEGKKLEEHFWVPESGSPQTKRPATVVLKTSAASKCHVSP